MLEEARAAVAAAMGARIPDHDKSGDDHYDVVSAFIKSLRGSDPDAAVYWMVRMLESGEDPVFILRRMVIFASEDIGLADDRALGLAVDAPGNVYAGLQSDGDGRVHDPGAARHAGGVHQGAL